MAWNKADLYPRVEKRAAALGKSVTDVSPKGYAFFADSKAGGTTIATLETIAENLKWTLCELLCEREPPPSPATVRPEMIKTAVTVALRAIPNDRLEKLPDATVSALDLLQAYEEDGAPIDEQALTHIERSLRVEYRDR